MAINKKSEFSPDDQSLATFANALSHPARVAILKLLAAQPGCICGQIVEVLPLSQSTVSQHLNELKKAGLVTGTIDGTKSCYCIDRTAFAQAAEELNKFAQHINEQQTENCC